MRKDKAFDCVEMQHLGAEKVKKKIDNMTLEEQLEFWRKGTEKLQLEQANRRKSNQ